MRTLLITLALTLTGAANASEFTLGPNPIVIEGAIFGNILPKANELLKVKSGIADVVINSPGGSVFAGWQFINAMKAVQSRGVKIRCTVTTMAASMAFQIFAACDERYAYKYSTLLWHPVRMGGNFILTPRQAVQITKQLVRIQRQLVSDLRETFSTEKDYFWKHYHAETLHLAVDVKANSASFLTIVTDVTGIEALDNIKAVKTDSKSIAEPNTDIFIYQLGDSNDRSEDTHSSNEAD
jgi:ATP-dependent protease ClpP protease subunit